MLLLSGTSVLAHPLDVVYFDIQTIDNSSYEMCMNIHPVPLKKVFSSEVISDDVFRTKAIFSVTAKAQACQISFRNSLVAENDAKLCYFVSCPEVQEHQAEDRRVNFDFLEPLEPLFTIIGKYRNDHGENLFAANQKNNFYAFIANQQNFFHLGVEHIGATIGAWVDENKNLRMADGIDHILFVLVLMLVSTSWRSLLINVTGFTVGHSISLGLSLAQIFTLPALYIEPAIAASIMSVALMAFLNNNYKKSLVVTVLFGFLHGMGFSYVLEGLRTSSIPEFLKTLFFFNVGIEVGQLIILVIFAPLFLFILKSPKNGVILKKAISMVIFLLAAYWTVQRTMNIFA